MTDTNEIELNPEGVISKPIDAFPRQTSQDTPPVPPVTVEKTLENGEVPTPPTPPAEVVPPVKVETPPATPPAQPVTPTAPEVKPEAPDYKKKFGESTRRNQIVESQFKELQKVLGDITKQEVPTDDEMVALISDWEYLSDREKNNERKLVVLERRQNHIISTIGNIASETDSASKFEEFVATEPRLKGKEDDFYDFVTKPSNKGASMEVLVNAFLFEETPITAVDPAPVIPPEELPPSLERGTPSGNMPPVKTGNEEMSADELKLLRTTDPRKYNEMIRKGQIK